MSINWYPGHMTRARKELLESLSLVDVVLEVLDARAPFSCRNPDLEALARKKTLVAVLNKAELADKDRLSRQMDDLKDDFSFVVQMSALKGTGKSELLRMIDEAYKPTREKLVARGRRPRPARVMVMGVPNVGKSTIINAIVGKKAARTGASPGVTRGKQWIKVADGIDLLDTPGLMWPKIENEEQGYRLAVLNIVGENAYEAEDVALYLLGYLINHYPEALKERYRIADVQVGKIELLQTIGRKRGFLNQGGEVDLLKTSHMLLDECRRGILGGISLE